MNKEELVKYIYGSFENAYNNNREIVIVCIGTPRVIGDSIGPFVGSFLKKKIKDKITVYGTIDNPVHALNICKYVELLKEKHKNAYILAIDAAFTSNCDDKMWDIIFRKNKPTKPGAGVGKEIDAIGQDSVHCVVGMCNNTFYFFDPYTELKKVNKIKIIKKACIISNSIAEAYYMLEMKIQNRQLFMSF